MVLWSTRVHHITTPDYDATIHGSNLTINIAMLHSRNTVHQTHICAQIFSSRGKYVHGSGMPNSIAFGKAPQREKREPVARRVSDFRGAKIAQNEQKMGSFHLYVHPKWPGMIFEKMHF